MARSVKEWIGKTDDSMPPETVRRRIFDRWGGRCHITGWKITQSDKWHLDHIKEIWEGGQNRESNMAPALAKAHRGKSAAAMSRKAKADRVRGKHIGATKEKKAWPLTKRFKRKLNGSVVRRDET